MQFKQGFSGGVKGRRQNNRYSLAQASDDAVLPAVDNLPNSPVSLQRRTYSNGDNPDTHPCQMNADRSRDLMFDLHDDRHNP